MKEIVSKLTSLKQEDTIIIDVDITSEKESNLLKVCEGVSELNQRTADLNNELIQGQELCVEPINISTQITENTLKSLYINIMIDKLMEFIINQHEEGVNLDQIQQLIRRLHQLDQITSNLINWLIKNQDKPQYIWLFGLFNYYNVDIEDDTSVNAFK